MRLLHISDLHLGFRQFQRLTEAGINQREADVAAAFRRAVDAMIDLRPDVILVGGDVFHAVRPPNPAILHAHHNFSRLKQALPHTDIIMIAGNHDTPRASESVCILRLFRGLGIHVVEGAPQRLSFPQRELSVLAVPYVPGGNVQLHIDRSARYNVLLSHLLISGVIPSSASREDRPTLEIDAKDLRAETWSYVALGHYHVYRQIAPNAFYSGSIEYTSTNSWGEIAEEAERRIPGKGFIEHNLATGEHRFHPIDGVRGFADLPEVSARGLTSLELDEKIRERVDACEGGIDGKVVRLVVRDVPRHIARELDNSAIRAYKRRALSFVLDARRPEVARSQGQGAPGRRRSLEDMVRDKLNSRALEGDIDRLTLMELGVRYLQDAEARVTAQVESEG